jgi:hypothetical protein
MAFQKGAPCGCADANCACEIEAVKGANPGAWRRLEPASR